MSETIAEIKRRHELADNGDMEGEDWDTYVAFEDAHADRATLLSALDEAQERAERAEAALRPFAAVVDLDVSEFCSDSDWFAPMSAQHARAPRLTVGDLRRARAALNQEPKP